MKLSLAAAALALLVCSSHAFAPITRQAVGSRMEAMKLYSLTEDTTGSQQGKALQKEIAERNSKVEDEEKYGVLDGANMEGAFATDDGDSSPVTVTDSSSLEAKMEQLVKPRAYPLFLAEKAAEVVESAISSVIPKFDLDSDTAPKTKERVLVLGTGWGSTSFLKEIDTDLYDVTVISPRNYFLFTPMLAGCSVGTVEYRSITEPIREVCTI